MTPEEEARTPEEWLRDPYDDAIAARLAYRQALIDAAPGPIPEYGTPEWAAADRTTQLASYAVEEGRGAVAHGKEISNRMAAEHQDRVDRQEASRAISQSIGKAEMDRLAANVAAGGWKGLQERRAYYPDPPAAAARGDPAKDAVDRAAESTAAAAAADQHDAHIAEHEHDAGSNDIGHDAGR